MDRRSFLASTAAASAVFLAGCGGNEPTNPGELDGTTDTTASVDHEVFITDSSVIDPIRLEIAVGDTVQWTNQDSNFFTHSLKSPKRTNANPNGDTFTESGTVWEFDVTLNQDASTRETFTEAGVYEYYSTRGGDGNRDGWEDICGAIIVGDATLDEDLPCE